VRRELADGPTLGRVDLERWRRAEQKSEGPSAGMWTGAGLVPGGLLRLLASLRDNLEFGPAIRDQSDQMDVWVVTGMWRPAILAKLLPEQAESILSGSAPDLSQLPPHLPSDVRIVLRREDLLPLQVDYRRRSGDSTVSAATAKSILVIDFHSIQRREKLDERHFIYQPGQQEVIDLTDSYLQRLEPAREGVPTED
jgi:hypothetical protein